MNTEIKQKWISALRSGKYAQGKEFLRNNDKYCCLGVLCEVIGVNRKSNGIGYRQEFENTETRTFTCSIPTEVIEYFDLNIEFSDMNHLAWLNDTEDKNFNEIADYIEEHF